MDGKLAFSALVSKRKEITKLQTEATRLEKALKKARCNPMSDKAKKLLASIVTKIAPAVPVKRTERKVRPATDDDATTTTTKRAFDGALFMSIEEPQRRVTIAYRVLPKEEDAKDQFWKIPYAAVIFRQDDNEGVKGAYNYKQQRQGAFTRLQDSALMAKFHSPTKPTTPQLRRLLRGLIAKYGTTSKSPHFLVAVPQIIEAKQRHLEAKRRHLARFIDERPTATVPPPSTTTPTSTPSSSSSSSSATAT